MYNCHYMLVALAVPANGDVHILLGGGGARVCLLLSVLLAVAVLHKQGV